MVIILIGLAGNLPSLDWMCIQIIRLSSRILVFNLASLPPCTHVHVMYMYMHVHVRTYMTLCVSTSFNQCSSVFSLRWFFTNPVVTTTCTGSTKKPSVCMWGLSLAFAQFSTHTHTHTHARTHPTLP